MASYQPPTLNGGIDLAALVRQSKSGGANAQNAYNLLKQQGLNFGPPPAGSVPTNNAVPKPTQPTRGAAPAPGAGVVPQFAPGDKAAVGPLQAPAAPVAAAPAGADYNGVVSKLRIGIGKPGGYPDLASWTAARKQVLNAAASGDKAAQQAAGAGWTTGPQGTRVAWGGVPSGPGGGAGSIGGASGTSIPLSQLASPAPPGLPAGAAPGASGGYGPPSASGPMGYLQEYMQQYQQSLQQAEQDIQQRFASEAAGNDPAVQAALQQLNYQAGIQNRQLTDSLNARGLLQSGVAAYEQNQQNLAQQMSKAQVLAQNYGQIMSQENSALSALQQQGLSTEAQMGPQMAQLALQEAQMGQSAYQFGQNLALQQGALTGNYTSPQLTQDYNEALQAKQAYAAAQQSGNAAEMQAAEQLANSARAAISALGGNPALVGADQTLAQAEGNIQGNAGVPTLQSLTQQAAVTGVIPQGLPGAGGPTAQLQAAMWANQYKLAEYNLAVNRLAVEQQNSNALSGYRADERTRIEDQRRQTAATNGYSTQAMQTAQQAYTKAKNAGQTEAQAEAAGYQAGMNYILANQKSILTDGGVIATIQENIARQWPDLASIVKTQATSTKTKTKSNPNDLPPAIQDIMRSSLLQVGGAGTTGSGQSQP